MGVGFRSISVRVRLIEEQKFIVFDSDLNLTTQPNLRHLHLNHRLPNLSRCNAYGVATGRSLLPIVGWCEEVYGTRRVPTTFNPMLYALDMAPLSGLLAKYLCHN